MSVIDSIKAIPNNPSIVLVGSVNSSLRTLEKLMEHRMNLKGILGLTSDAAKNVSGFINLEPIAKKYGVPYFAFAKINDPLSIAFIRSLAPDILFVVGLSQLVSSDILKIPACISIGFHPTQLPKGRGRAALAWMILGKVPGAATFFRITEGVDDGDIVAQVPFDIESTDYAADILKKILVSIDIALDAFLPTLKSGYLKLVPQEEEKATYLGKRNPEDGMINWSDSVKNIYDLIRASSSPLPGAFTYLRGRKLTINRARIETEKKIIGVPGRILSIEKDNQILVQTGSGVLWIDSYSSESDCHPRVGDKFGVDFYKELIKLQSEIDLLKSHYGKI